MPISAVFASVFASSWAIVSTMRTPVAPNGWPMATLPVPLPAMSGMPRFWIGQAWLGLEPEQGGPVAGAELQHRLAAGHGGKGIAGLVAVAPEPVGEAELVQGGGLHGRQPLAWAQLHGHLGFDPPGAGRLPGLAPLHLHQHQGGAAVAGTSVRFFFVSISLMMRFDTWPSSS